jgi:hypothetical protein
LIKKTKTKTKTKKKEEEEEEEEEEDEEVPTAGGMTGGGSDRVSTQSSTRTKFTIDLNRLSGPLPISSSDEVSHAESLIHWVTEVSPPTTVVTLAPDQHPGFPSPGFFPPLSGAFTLDLAKAIEKMEQDSTPKASHQPSPKDGVPPPVSHIPSAQGRSSSSAAEGSTSSIGGINIVPEKFFNQSPVSALWADQVNKEEALLFLFQEKLIASPLLLCPIFIHPYMMPMSVGSLTQNGITCHRVMPQKTSLRAFVFFFLIKYI